MFPGGRVDAEDAPSPPAPGAASREAHGAATRLGDNRPPDAALAIHRAALRELREEAGIDLAGPDALAPIAHWTTPRFMPRRFSTWFFVADLPPDAEPIFSPDEVAAHRWLTPSAALDQVAAGEIEMWVPTTSVLERLVEIGAEVAADVEQRITLDRVVPPRILSETATEVRFAFGAAGGLPGRVGETILIGRRELIVVDPGDPSDAAIDALQDAIARRGGAVRAIVLSQPDPDHAAAAEALAIPLEVPILVAPGAGRHLPYATREVADGERLSSDVGVAVRLGPVGSGRLAVVGPSAGE